MRAIRNGEVDAVMVTGQRGEQVYTLSGADRVYRQLIETMSEGAAILSADAVILYGNVCLAELLGQPLAQVLGTALRNYLPPEDQQALDTILAQARTKPSRGEINLQSSESRLVPVYLSASRLPSEEAEMVFCLVLTDLTEQKRHEQMVADERLARLILEQAAEAIVVCDEQSRVVRASRAAQQFCGGSLLSRPFAEVFPLRTGASDPFQLAPVLQGGMLRNVDVALDRQGQTLDLILNADPLLNGQQILGCVVTLTDITERKRAEEKLHASEVRYRRLFEAAKDGVLILDAETGMVVDVNPFLAQLLGISREAFLGKKVWELGCFKNIVANEANFETLRREEYIRYEDKPLETADGRRIDVEFVSNLYQVNHHAVMQCNIRDITTRKLTEWRALIYKDQLRALSARIETMREEERTRISREIHDKLGQMLTGIKMDLRWMEHRLDEFGEDRRVNPILDKLVVTAELTDATIKAVQRIAADLRPGILDKLGLPITLQYEAGRFEKRTGIACRLVVPGEALPLRLEAAIAFFRIFQEALTNVTRHAKATAVEAELQPEADGCRLEIRDNGQGMAGVDLANLKSLGLLGMQERASLLGGGVSFAPRPGGGTVVTVRIPNRPTQRGGV